MKRIFIALAVISMIGCTTIAKRLPTVQNCQEVHYDRVGSKVTILMECDVSKEGLYDESSFSTPSRY
jgi:hypothetical protein